MSNPISFLQATRGLNTPKGANTRTGQIRYFFRCCLNRRLMRAWLGVFETAEFARLYQLQPRVALKPTRVYLSTAWDFKKRFAMLYSHYALMRRLVPVAVMEKIFGDGHELMHIVNTTTGRRLVLRLLNRMQFEREGELTLALEDGATGLPLVRMSFCVAEDTAGAGLRFYVGGLQACNDARVRRIIHDLAKEMHGLRAKALVLWCVQQLAARWGAAGIHGVDDAHHMTTKRTGVKKLAACYDEFWAESDGQHDAASGFWEIPVQPRRRSREELKPSRRKQHEQRYAFLDDMSESLQEAFENFETAEFFYASPLKVPVVTAAETEGKTPEIEVSMAGLA